MYHILKQLDIAQLMCLRLALDKPEPYHDIGQDIQDLYSYPERLSYTYPEEWRLFVRQQLIKRGISDEALNAWLTFQTNTQKLDESLDISVSPDSLLAQVKVLQTAVANSVMRFSQAQAVLVDVQNIQSAAKVTIFEPQLKRQLNQLLDE